MAQGVRTYNLYVRNALYLRSGVGKMASTTKASTAGPPALALDDAAVEAQGRRAAQVENTRRALLDAARQLFTDEGYQATRTEEVVRRAGLTRGALYHHFRDKEDLFRSVFAEVEEEVFVDLVRRSSDGSSSAWQRFRRNSQVHLLAASENPSYRQICLVDGPAVLGQTEWMLRRGGPQGRIAGYLREAIEEGSIDPLPVEPLAQLLTSLGVGSAMYIAQAEDHAAALRDIELLTERLISGLRAQGGEPDTSKHKMKQTREKETS